ncbi:hypothetical protein FOPG_17390 [Fusarium oxysporum f. sp. conglutinans race 2 54008]|uniref:Xylanolytic transcriptional activator regulatory domain-containing protein n=1 Tax=Fusarium oxysporum f. sp. conglutinans race 2 54008 TaxID=1089457 RepID=X0HZB0_FUSOX|nr:hypothetical protein FOPG_17390 [Fusarium oxysporum f. sp. conglutinans race 2 54008]
MDAGDATASCIWPWSSVTMMDAGDTAASCIWPWSSVTTMDPGDTAVSCVWPWSSDFNNENSPCAYGSLNLDHESARIEAIQPTPYLAEASKTWTPSPGHLWSTGYNDYLTVSNEIMSRLRNEICHKRSGQAMYPHGWSSQIENECFALFGPNSLMKFTEEYWSTWYIHWPAIHRATFRISQAPPALVASMVLLATSYSPDVHTRELARRWGDAVEAIVFTDEHFGSATLFSTLNAACLERRLRALQAGLAICVYQTFEGSAVASRKARRSRFNDIVDMGRELGFQNGQHTDLQNVTHDTFCWKEFILKEELIRTLTSIIILDSSFSIIYNTVPKVMVEEVQTDLFCPEACFQASTESECLQHLVAWVSHPLRKGRRISFADALKILSATQLDSQTQQMFTQFGELNLFVLTAGIVIGKSI